MISNQVGTSGGRVIVTFAKSPDFRNSGLSAGICFVWVGLFYLCEEQF